MAVNGNPSLPVQKDSMKVEITGSVSSQQQMTINTTNLNAVNSGTTMAALVSNLSTLVGNTNSRNVTAYITSRPPISISSNIGHIAKPVMVAHGSQPLLLPKPTQTHKLPQKQHIQSTPPKFNNTFQNSSVLTSPLHTSPAICPSPLQSRKRSHVETTETDTLDSKRRRGPDKGGKGLRHFSMKVCEKVQLKGVTSYNEVADELVQEFSDSSNGQQTPLDQSYDQKNIRRRVYDALNVLMAMNIITKEKKEIKWVGLPTNSAQECKRLEEQKKERIERIKQKKHQLRELIVQQIAFKNLVERNKRLEKKNGAPQSNACIHLPFIIVNTSKKTVIDCSISSDKSEYLFNFDEAFEIRDDIEVLKRLGLSFGLDKGECSEKNLRIARNMVPKALAQYVNQMANGNQAPVIGLDGSATSPPLAQPLTQHSSPGPSSKCDESENDGDDEHSSIMTS